MPVPRAPKKTAFVPRIVFRAAVAGVGVVPMCVAACGGETSGSGDSGGLGVAAIFADGGGDAGGDVELTVACCFGGVGVSAFADGGNPRDAGPEASTFDGPFFNVAYIGFDASRTADSGVADAAFAGDSTTPDGPMGVGVSAFADGGDARSPADAAKDALIFTVAAHGFDGGGD